MKGMTSEDHKLLVQGKWFSEIPVMSTEGIHVHLFKGNVNDERFQEFTTNSLLPILDPLNWSNSHSVIIMDNMSLHHVHGVVYLIGSQGARLVFLPPYSPDLNPLKWKKSLAKSRAS